MSKKKPKERKRENKRNLLGLFIILGIIILYFVLNWIFDFHMKFNVETIQLYITKAGIWAPLLFIFTMAAAIVISPIPSLPLDAAGGAVWGPALATVYAVIGAEIGAVIAFMIARKLGRGYVEKHFHRQIRICYRCSDTYLFWVVLIARLFPFFQFDIISYGAGLTNMKLRSFAIATFIGMIPMTYVFASLGKSFISGNLLIGIASLVVIAGFFIVPVFIEKYNVLGLRGKIIVEKK